MNTLTPEKELKEWQTLRLWGWTPKHIHDFIRGQQTRIHEAQNIEKTCEQLERERDEARELAQQMSESNQVLQAEVRDYRKTADNTHLSNNEMHLNLVLQEVAKLAKTLKRERDEARMRQRGGTCVTTATIRTQIRTSCPDSGLHENESAPSPSPPRVTLL